MRVLKKLTVLNWDLPRLITFSFPHIDGINEANKQNMLDMFTDSDFLSGTYKTIRYMLQQNMNVYQYVLSYEGSLSSGTVL